MIIRNTRFGTIEIADDRIIRMARSMPGFPGRKRFILIDREESRPFMWYQCVDDPALAFAIINPSLFEPDYSFDLKTVCAEMDWGGTEEKENLAVFVVVNASGGVPDKMTANLMAPLLIHTDRREAVQVILENSPYSHKHPIFGKAAA